MTGDPIIHVIRPAPMWSTCEPITICGNRSRAGDKTPAELAARFSGEFEQLVREAQERRAWRERKAAKGPRYD